MVSQVAMNTQSNQIFWLVVLSVFIYMVNVQTGPTIFVRAVGILASKSISFFNRSLQSFGKTGAVRCRATIPAMMMHAGFFLTIFRLLPKFRQRLTHAATSFLSYFFHVGIAGTRIKAARGTTRTIQVRELPTATFTNDRRCVASWAKIVFSGPIRCSWIARLHYSPARQASGWPHDNLLGRKERSVLLQ